MGHQQYTVQFTAQEHAELVESETDDKPIAPHEVIGRNVKSLVSPGTELAGYQGQYTWGKWPYNPGYASIIQVTEVGSDVTKVKPGDLAFCMGVHQLWQRFPSENVVPLPHGLSSDTAPFARLMCVTMSTLTTTTARPPAKVIVTGLGIVGHLAARMFASCGYDVLGVDPVETRRAAAQNAGLKHVASSIPRDNPDYAGKVALVVECSGHEQAAMDACNVVQKKGEVVIVAAMWKRRTELTAYELLDAVFHRYVVVRSGWEWELPLAPTDFGANSIFGNIAGALRWLAEGRLSVDGLALTASPRDAQQAYHQLLHEPGKSLSVLFDWSTIGN